MIGKLDPARKGMVFGEMTEDERQLLINAYNAGAVIELRCSKTWVRTLAPTWSEDNAYWPRPEQPAGGDEMKLYYMRDNHTFRPLPLDIEGAIAGCREEFDAGYTSGMLCRTPHTFPEINVHAMSDWSDFEARAREWLAEVLP
jgi:hypothetical protein